MHLVIGKASHPLSTPPLLLALHPVFGQGCTVRTHGPGSHRPVRTAWTLHFVPRRLHGLGCAPGLAWPLAMALGSPAQSGLYLLTPSRLCSPSFGTCVSVCGRPASSPPSFCLVHVKFT